MRLVATLSFYLTLLFLLFGCGQKDKEIQTLLGTSVSEKKLDAFIEIQMEILDMPGLSIAIINDGRVAYHRVKGYANKEKKVKVDKQSIFEGASISKPVFGHFVMTFVEEGILDLDKPLYQYLANPDIEYDERYKKITARMVLSHRSGFPNWRYDYPDQKLFIQFEPGSDYHYSGEGYQYLAEVLKHLLGKNWAGLEEEFQKRIASPLGMAHTAFIQTPYIRKNKVQPYDETGNWVDKNVSELWQSYDSVFVAPTTIHSEALDFSKWVIGMMEEKGLSKAGFEELFKTESSVAQEGLLDINYSLGFNKLSILGLKTIYQHNGNNTGFSSFFMLDREKKWGLVLFTNSEVGDPFSLRLTYDMLLVGPLQKQVAIGIAILFSTVLLILNLILSFTNSSDLKSIRRFLLTLSLLTIFGILAGLILMLVSNSGNWIPYAYILSMIILVSLIFRAIIMMVKFWNKHQKHGTEIVIQTALLLLILSAAFLV